jgi:hypothetical protein
MPNRNTEYEEFVKSVMESLLQAQGLATVKVEHDISITGISGVDHQIDVYWEYRLGGITHKVAIDCKNYKSRVKKEKVQAMKGVVDDVPGMRGIIVTTAGFQSGAITYAKAHGLGLKIIRQAIEADYAGRIREIEINFTFRGANVRSVQIKVDKEWFERHRTPELESVVNTLSLAETSLEMLAVEDRAAQTRSSFRELVNSLPLTGKVPGSLYSHRFDWTDSYLVIPGKPGLKIALIELQFQIGESTSSMVLGHRLSQTLIRDAVAGTLLFVDEHGTFSGDVDEEIGQ